MLKASLYYNLSDKLFQYGPCSYNPANEIGY